ncbi:unnamed protein product [Rotaria socialis]|uniref:F-box domain-containing protein n=2 Tax=Rotaria socialis TaxID=392032 RepID=A0A818FXK5_9BILA|nr:unnamed protein product [Rotaria socialis]
MSKSNLSSLLTLSVELVHVIFDYLDTRTILLSLGYVCPRLRAITNTYERLILNFRSISKSDFHHMCRIVRPENVISLILSNDDETPGQIELFLSLFDTRQFIRLRSLTVFAIEDDNLNRILNHAIHNSLISLSIERSHSSNHPSTTLNILSSAMSRPTLRKFKCTIDWLLSDSFIWPRESNIKHLTIDRCTYKQFCTILRHLSQLRTIVLRSFNLDIHNEYEYQSTSYPQLISLSMGRLFLSMDKIESFLCLTPSLVHLRLEGSADDAIFNGSRWEKLIRTKLPSLNRFDFCFRSQNRRVIELSAIQFRTPFWLNEKHWPVNCVYDDIMEEVLLCSTPDFITRLEYNFNGPVVISTTIQNICNGQSSQYFFRRIVELELSQYLLDSLHFTSKLVDFSQVMELRILLSDRQKFISKTQEQLINLLKETNHIRSLKIFFEHGFIIDFLLIENICSLVPHHVKHLDIEAKTLADIYLIIERLQHLSSITFRRLPFSLLPVTEWNTQLKRDVAYRYNQDALHIWLDKSPTEGNRTETFEKARCLCDTLKV